MQRTLEELAKFHSQPDSDVVHDLRVAIRRSRSVAATVMEIDPHSDWVEMRAIARKLFRAMGALRDAQVTAEWLKELQPQEGALKNLLLESLASRERTALKNAGYQAERFDQDRWGELRLVLVKRLRVIPLDSDAARCLALERLAEAKELHRRALRTEKPAAWHRLRIGVKRFRYTLESLLPALHETHSESLKRIQDVLGDIHDLDVVSDLVSSHGQDGDDRLQTEWEQRISNARQENLLTYRQMALGSASVWQTWMASFPHDRWLTYSSGRIAATRRALDRNLKRSLSATRLAKSIWKQLAVRSALADVIDQREWQVLSAAVRLSGIRVDERGKTRARAVRTFLLDSPVPPGWSFAEWEQVAWAIRYQRGAAPSEKNRRFAKLSIEQQVKIMRLAGILRIALVLVRFGVRSGAAVTIQNLPDGLLFEVSGAQDTPENAARFTKAKGLLERSLGKTLLMRAVSAEQILAQETAVNGASSTVASAPDRSVAPAMFVVR